MIALLAIKLSGPKINDRCQFIILNLMTPNLSRIYLSPLSTLIVLHSAGSHKKWAFIIVSRSIQARLQLYLYVSTIINMIIIEFILHSHFTSVYL